MSIPILISLIKIAPTTPPAVNPFSQDIFFGFGGVHQIQDGEVIDETAIANLYPLTVQSLVLADATDFAFVNATIGGVVQAFPFAVTPQTTVTFNFNRITDGDLATLNATVSIN